VASGDLLLPLEPSRDAIRWDGGLHSFGAAAALQVLNVLPEAAFSCGPAVSDLEPRDELFLEEIEHPSDGPAGENRNFIRSIQEVFGKVASKVANHFPPMLQLREAPSLYSGLTVLTRGRCLFTLNTVVTRNSADAADCQ
jgi:hypothetical protein